MDKPQTTNDNGDMKEMLTLAVGCFAREITGTDITDLARAHYQKAYDLASKMLDKYWKPS